MAKRLAPRVDILPAAQQRLWPELEAVPKPFVLYGGTGLALHLGHRVSVDFDFFAAEPIDTAWLLDTLPFLRGAVVAQQEPNTLSCVVERGDPVQVSFFGLPHLGRVRTSISCVGHSLKVASLLDLAATKAAVVQRRASAKDYLDIDALIQAGVTLSTALAAAGVVYGPQFAAMPSLKALTFFDEGDLDTLTTEVKARLVEAVRGVDVRRLPRISRPWAPRKEAD